MNGGTLRLNRGDDCAGAADGIARLLAMAGLRAIARLAGGVGVVLDSRRRDPEGGGAAEVGAEGAGRDHGDADAERRHLLGQRIRHRLDAELDHVVVADARVGDEPADRADVDDMPAPACPHPGQHRLDQLQRSEQVGVEQGMDVLVLAFLDRGQIAVAGVVDEHVHAAEAGLGRRDRRRDLARIGHVELDRKRRLAVRGREVGDVVALSRGDDDTVARGECLLGKRTAEPLGTAGDEPDCVFRDHGPSSILRWRRRGDARSVRLG